MIHLAASPPIVHHLSTVVVRVATTLLALLMAVTSAQALTAASPDDVCPASADPCTVTGVVDVADGSILDFQRRAVEVTGDGQLRFGVGDATIRCGSFHADTAGPALRAGGPLTPGKFGAGTVAIETRRGCDAGPPEVTCTGDTGCHLGSCGVKRCSLKAARTCNDDTSCQVGPCQFGRCQNAFPSLLRCSTNSDCDLGTCPDQLTCSGMANVAKNCAVNADCDLGACTVGDASIDLDAPVDGAFVLPPEFRFTAVDNVVIAGPVNLSSQDEETDGGTLYARTLAGDVVLDGLVLAKGGGLGRGGHVDLHSARDIEIGGRINLNGGDFDGGDFDLESGRDIAIRATVTSSSVRGGGFGGWITVTAGRNLTVGGSAGDPPMRMTANGHSADHLFGGDGGVFDLWADGDLAVGANVLISGRGAVPSGFGSDIYLTAYGNLVVDADLRTSTRGQQGRGGTVDGWADGSVVVGPESDIRASGSPEGGASLGFRAGGPLLFAGRGDVGGAGDRGDSLVELVSHDDLDVTGSITAAGDQNTEFRIDACRIRVASGATLRNRSAADTTLKAHESMSLAPGSTLSSPHGSNVLIYRTASKPPVIDGTVSGPPELVVNAGLLGCPVCGNSEIDQYETCDDGNTTPGDGCDADCQIE